jgi:hypothetical protein
VTLALLNETLKLSFPLLETLFHQFRNQQLLEVKGMTGNDYSFSLTASGRTQAAGRNEICHYVGPAPDLPGSPGAETGDAWLGVFKSYDGGQSWRSTVHPGCAQKIAACDGAPLLKSYTAGRGPGGPCRHQRPVLFFRHRLHSRHADEERGFCLPLHRQQ